MLILAGMLVDRGRYEPTEAILDKLGQSGDVLRHPERCGNASEMRGGCSRWGDCPTHQQIRKKHRLHIAPLQGPRVALTPLAVTDAEVMVEVLADPELYRFTGDAPPTLAELTARYERQVSGPPADSRTRWLNWIVRYEGRPVGYVQATVQEQPGAELAELAWVIGTAAQGRGLAAEAAGLMADWIAGQGVPRLVASIQSGHRASERVAERIGLTLTGVTDEEGERVWERNLSLV